MMPDRPLHPDFLALLERKQGPLIDLFKGLRQYVLAHCPTCNELLYHTHALTAVFSLSNKLGDAFCMIPIYTNHFNLGFNKGTLLPDPHGLLQGTGNLIRHIPITAESHYRNPQVKALLQAAIAQAQKDMEKPSKAQGQTICKIK